MHLITGSCVLFLWMYTLTLVKSQAITCRLTLPPQEGTTYEPSRNVFSPGDTVRVICGNKYWISHPRGTSAVITCKEDGDWTLHPVCQEVVCSNQRPQHVYHWSVASHQRITLGETATYSCGTGYKKTDGASLAKCTRDGWNPDPLCQAITCNSQSFEESEIDGEVKTIYRYRERVHYVCKAGYKGRFTRTCEETGWTGTPQCTTIRCRLTLPPQEGTTYEPSRNVFSPGDTVRVMCGNKYWIGTYPRGTSAVITCQEEGDWTLHPVCQEVVCSNQRPQHVYHWSVALRQRITLGETATYSCGTGYKKTDGASLAKCTRDGWNPDPLCQAITCNSQSYEESEIDGEVKTIYRYREQVHYVCKAGYKGRFTRTCEETGWTGTPQCTTIRCRLTLPPQEGTTYEPSRNVFSPGDTVRVMCGNKYWISYPRGTSAVITCQEEGDWTLHPVCQEVVCSNQRPQHVYHWSVALRQRITLGETATYSCRTGYKKTDGASLAKCTRDGWNPDPLCQAITCNSQSFEESEIDGEVKTIYRYRERVHYVCKAGSEGRFTRTCEETGWIGTPQCTRTPCKKLDIDNATITSIEKDNYRLSEHVEYACRNDAETVFTVTCEQGGWTGIRNCSAPLGCGTSPPITDGDTTETLRFHHSHEERVHYRCQSYYTMEGEPYNTCFNGEWIGRMKCLKPCTVEREAIRSHNIEFRYGSQDKLYLVHNDHVTFVCISNRTPVDTSAMRCQCVDGEMHLPTCQ
ncbi:complement factor H-related protein 4-like [Lycodopsis pacificus]